MQEDPTQPGKNAKSTTKTPKKSLWAALSTALTIENPKWHLERQLFCYIFVYFFVLFFLVFFIYLIIFTLKIFADKNLEEISDSYSALNKER